MPKSDDDETFLERRLKTISAGGLTLLTALQVTNDDGQEVQLFFKSGDDANAIIPPKGLKLTNSRSIGDGPLLQYANTGPNGSIELLINGDKMEITPQAPETDLFKGLNVGFATRNGESPKIVFEWLKYHVEKHGMTGALILNRDEPSEGKGFFNQLKAKCKKIKGLKRLVVLDCDAPLGAPDQPDEAHPFSAPGAPGKDRMKIPPADAWKAPLGDLLIYELVRAQFLNKARAVANIDVYDLVADTGGDNIFDQACNSSTGCIRLDGAQVYPWRVRNNQPATFGDHICVPFDAKGYRRRWCVAPHRAGPKTVWRLIRVVGCDPTEDETAIYHRHMSLRHPTDSVSKIVPKTSLVEDEYLLKQATGYFNFKPIHIPEEKLAKVKRSGPYPQTTIVTTMKNEGPFILEWLAYHRIIGVTGIIVYTNDCTDGTDTMLDMLQEKGIVQHRINRFEGTGLKPQHAALQASETEAIVRSADWLICMDVDEYINIHAGDGTLDALFTAIGDANMISLTWRLFGNNNVHEFHDNPLLADYTRCAPEMARKPHQAWGFKTLFRNNGIFKKMGVHRPKGLKPQLWEDINWVNGSGAPMPHTMFRNGWRSTVSTVGYDLVQLNHYAVRSAESFLVKRDRGRVNHVDRDQGLSYWFRMNNNFEENTTIQRMLPALRAEMDKLLEDPDIRAAHEYSVEKHRDKIAELKATENYSAFYEELTSERMENLSHLHQGFGANVFLMGPGVIPDDVAAQDPNEPFFFTVDKGETTH